MNSETCKQFKGVSWQSYRKYYCTQKLVRQYKAISSKLKKEAGSVQKQTA